MENLNRQRQIWKNKKILRKIYDAWYRKIVSDLSKIDGLKIELGSGSGNFKEFKPDAISSDVQKTGWLDICFDAQYMPFNDNSVTNLVMIDVLHHLSNPIMFFAEATRVLKKNGRVLVVEPFPSPISQYIYKKFHPEPFLMNVDYFSQEEIENKDPWQGNQSIAYLLFFKHRKQFETRFDESLSIRKCHRMSCILYPASGGFKYNALIPNYLIPLLSLAEILLTPFRWLLAFRCYVVLEKE